MTHHCHALGCRSECPPRWLMCHSCWDKVPRTIQAEVHNTVTARGPAIGPTWAPWWRAQARAIAEVGFSNDDVGKRRYLDKEFAFAAKLEGRAKVVQ